MGFGSNPFGRGRPSFTGGPGGGVGGGGGLPVHFRLTGDKELLAVLGGLTTSKQFFLAQKKALDAGGGVMKQAIVANAMAVKDTGLLAKSIKVRLAPPKYKNAMLAVVGPTHMHRMMRRTKKGSLRVVSSKKIKDWQAKGERLVSYNPGNYGHLVERGTKGHFIELKTKKAMVMPGGRHPFRTGEGGIPVWHPGTKGIGFMRRAVDSRGRAAVDKMNRKLWEEIRRLMTPRIKVKW